MKIGSRVIRTQAYIDFQSERWGYDPRLLDVEGTVRGTTSIGAVLVEWDNDPGETHHTAPGILEVLK